MEASRKKLPAPQRELRQRDTQLSQLNSEQARTADMLGRVAELKRSACGRKIESAPGKK